MTNAKPSPKPKTYKKRAAPVIKTEEITEILQTSLEIIPTPVETVVETKIEETIVINATTPPDLEYIAINYIHGYRTIVLQQLKDFQAKIQQQNTTVVYTYTASYPHNVPAQPYWILLEEGNMAWLLPTSGYKTIADITQSKQQGFATPADFYTIQEQGFVTAEDYQICKRLGFKTKIDLDNAVKNGFEKALDSLKKWHKDNVIENSIFELFYKDTIGVFYYEAIQRGFKNFEEFKKSVCVGFDTMELYKTANEKGFTNVKAYNDATKKGFSTYKEYGIARQNNIHTYVEYQLYQQLTALKTKLDFSTMEETHTYWLLQQLECGKKIALSKIWELMDNEKEKITIEQKSKNNTFYKLPDWYSCKFTKLEDLRTFLSSNKVIRKQIGTHDTDGDLFEKTVPSVLTDKQIIIDGSNVAWYGKQKEKNESPSITSIALVIDALRKKGYKNILCLVDASLQHQVNDTALLEQLEKKKLIKSVPSKSVADSYIIKYAEQKNAFIVTNDRYRDWAQKNSWLADNIDHIRIDFMIVDKIVKFGEVLSH